VNRLQLRPISALFPYPDDLKFRSCMTLFHEAGPDVAEFREALKRYYGGEADAETLRRLK